jgi:hypothetical protein
VREDEREEAEEYPAVLPLFLVREGGRGQERGETHPAVLPLSR